MSWAPIRLISSSGGPSRKGVFMFCVWVCVGGEGVMGRVVTCLRDELVRGHAQCVKLCLHLHSVQNMEAGPGRARACRDRRHSMRAGAD